ncbi:putative porin [Bradyrhizobium sp. dw_78]|uniref:putative porin n=1 Tax=Bradyrhizobium sp. dw_78 TaxID=2719793 RepID=UPI001BD24C88|nr:putative porin [Bradyrhizobium sp. dw_78]
MFDMNSHARWRELPLAVSLCALLGAAPAFAQNAADPGSVSAGKSDKKSDPKKPSLSQAIPTSPNATINLINLMVKRGMLKEEDAQALIKQADDEAYVSRQAAKDASAKADEAAKAATAAAAAANPPGTRHVTYVPEIVKRQLREEIKQEVMAKAEKENWASPGAYPEWAQRIHFYGDIRARYQGSFFPSGNDPTGATNFSAINNGSPFDDGPTNPYFAPSFDTSQNREQFRLRARLGMDADLSNGFTAGLRIATGDSNSPVSTNQTFGNNGGDFSKYELWLDRGFVKYQSFNEDFALSVGRFDNPFWSPTDLVWYKELGFDGFAVQAKREMFEGFTPFAVGGAFPIYNTDLNAGINLGSAGASPTDPTTGAPTKFESNDKWLFGGQAGFGYKINPEYAVRFAVAYYDFDNVQGHLSDPCTVSSASDVCDTDLNRPLFSQKGNTYMTLRNIIPDPVGNNNGAIQYQYFGLASQYRPLVVSGQVDLSQFQPAHIVFDGDYVVNTAFDRNLMIQTAVNNKGPSVDGSPSVFNGGNQGWLGRVTVGNTEIKHLGDWNVHVGYKYLESDATIDAFVDSDFGLGGTNLKGYFLGGNYGLSDNVWMTARWMSATNVAGSPYAVDVLQVDLNAKF